VWTYLLGPIVAAFPNPWRRSLPFAEDVHWGRATAISGLAESVLALVALMYWYSYSMTTWVGNGTAVALTGKMGPEVRVQDIGAAALIIWATHPITWLLGLVGLEGAVRLCTGAFASNPCGVLPLFILDKIVFSPFRRSTREPLEADDGQVGVSSVASAVRERIHAATRPELPDELHFTIDGSEEIMEIYASRRKPDWIPPRVVRYFDTYYRLEADSSAGGSRPFRYRLRRLPVGVPGRTVILYSPSDAIIRDADGCHVGSSRIT